MQIPEQQADHVQAFIEYLEVTVAGYPPDEVEEEAAMLRHLNELHKLRDKAIEQTVSARLGCVWDEILENWLEM